MSEKWGPWIRHCGTRYPVELRGCFVEIVFRCGDIWRGVSGVDLGKTVCGFKARRSSGSASSWVWGTYNPKWDAVQYRIREFREIEKLKRLAEQPSEVEPA